MGTAVITRAYEPLLVRRDSRGRPCITLRLRGADREIAQLVARQINATLFPIDAKRVLEVAEVVDGGSVNVWLPDPKTWARIMNTSYPGFDAKPELLVDQVREVGIPVDALPEATVFINQATRTLCWAGSVTVRRGILILSDGTTLRIDRNHMSLDDLLEQAPDRKYETVRDIIDVLFKGGLLKAKVISH